MKLSDALSKAIFDAEMSDGFFMDAFLASLEESGFCIVPKEATKEMASAGDDALESALEESYSSDAGGNSHDYFYLRAGAQTEVYAAMLAARPTIED